MNSQWQEARNSDGRPYYYNAVTKETQWTKPDELMTPDEVRKGIGVGLVRDILTCIIESIRCFSENVKLGGNLHCRRQEVLVRFNILVTDGWKADIVRRYHKETKESSWTMPEEISRAMEAAKAAIQG